MNNNQSTQPSAQLSKQEAQKTSPRRQFELLKNHPWLLLVMVGALSLAISAFAISSLVSIGRVDKPIQTSSNPDETTQFSEPKQNKSTNWLLAIFLVGAGAGAVVIYRRRKGLAMPNFSWDIARNSWHTAKSRLTRRKQRKLLLQQSKTNAYTGEPQPVVVASPLDTKVVTASSSPLSTDVVANEDSDYSSNLDPEVFVLSLEDLVDDDLPLPTEIEVIEASLDNSPEAVFTILPPEDEQSSDPSTRSLAEMMDIRKHLSISAILQDFYPRR